MAYNGVGIHYKEYREECTMVLVSSEIQEAFSEGTTDMYIYNQNVFSATSCLYVYELHTNIMFYIYNGICV